jgi:hypothetical protein
MLCGSGVYDKYLSNYNLENKIANQESHGGKLKFGAILNIFHRELLF